MGRYRSYPRIVGETGGKDFIVAHPSADRQALAVGDRARRRSSTRARSARRRAASTSRGRSGPTCATASSAMIGEIRMGDVARLPQLHGRGDRQKGVRRASPATSTTAKRTAKIVAGGGANGEKGYFIEPTLVETRGPGLPPAVRGDLRAGRHGLRLRRRAVARRRCSVVDETSPYALTGAVFARRSARGPRGGGGAAQRGRQLLRQRQADRRGRRPAAVRRRARRRARTTRRARS